MTFKFPYLRPVLPQPEKWVPYLKESYDQHYFSNFGPLASKFQDSLAEQYLNETYEATVVASNTLGMQAVLTALNVRGRYVILPDFTFPATLHAIIAAGGKPLICDVSSETGELDLQSVSQALSRYKDVAAIIHVRCFGFVQDVTSLKALCKTEDIALVIDAAAALAKPKDQIFGSKYEEIEVFSLHATKVFAVGEGGFIAAPEAFSSRLRSAINFGFQSDRSFKDGTNAKMDEFRAAIGLSMLDHVEEIVSHRQHHAALYRAFFQNRDGFKGFDVPDHSSWPCFPICVDKGVRDKIVKTLSDHNIEVKIYYRPGLIDGYQGRYPIEALEVETSQALQNTIICLPIYSEAVELFWPELEIALEKALAGYF